VLTTADYDGHDVIERILDAYEFAAVDPYRAATHNKGIMNGVDAVAIATGNDWRSVEAGAHAFAARDGRYTSLTRWWREDGHLHGFIEIPMAVGVVGGSTNVHPTIGVLRKILGIESAAELGMVMAAVGLSQNMGALRALSTEGINRGHMTLHARSVALAAGAEGKLVDEIAAELVAMGQIKIDVAQELLAGRSRRKVG
jgi:hydroxymethylglutaryl-CoA reductase